MLPQNLFLSTNIYDKIYRRISNLNFWYLDVLAKSRLGEM